ncbi:hypothetical protein WR25_00142 [Diploscapter pachys]|uniref:Amino acid permease/ SLC12A domain-containing protein n=1 Tax=Diploscapter pachys TaxID=2018661 RepID=A0A2A2JLU4_9BILA|nr:hypothetical protein WR25_00142 [Diploscapter pachys]
MTGGGSPSGEVKLQRRISLFNGVTIIVGVIVGSGIFVSPKGVFAMLGALCYAELGTSIPKSGGDYAYIHEAFGGCASFLFLWVALVIVNPTSIAIIALTFANYALQPFYGECPPSENIVNLLAACVIAILTFINCYSVKITTITNDFFTITKVVALGAIIIAGCVSLFQGNFEHIEMPELMTGSNWSPSSLSLAFYSGVFSFSGFSYLNFVTEELQDPFRNLPRAIYISIPLVTLLYLFVNIAYFSVLSVDEILDSAAVAITFSERIFQYLAYFMPFFVACSCIGSLNGILFTCSRMFFAGARIGQLPELLSMISVHFLTPMPSLIFLGATSIIMLFSANIYELINYLAFAESLVVFSSVAGLLLMRFTKKDLDRPIKLNIIIPILFFAMCLFLLIFPFFNQPKELFVGVGLILSGLPVYFLFVYNTRRPSCLYNPWICLTHFIQKVLCCVPESEGKAAEE